MRAALTISLGLNFFLAAGLVLARVDPSRDWFRMTGDQHVAAAGASLAEDADAADNRSGPDTSAASLAGYYAALRHLGMRHEETFLPLGGWVLSALSAAAEQPAPYWQPAGDHAAVQRRRRIALEESLRAQLVGIYGETVIERPEFFGLFFPLGAAFDFMSSEQQIAVHNWQRADAVPASSGSNPLQPVQRSLGAGCERGTAGVRQVASDVQPTLPAAIGPDVRFELALRTSPFALRLRALDLDEQTFRAAHERLSRVLTAGALAERIEARRSLQSLLGAARTDELLRAFDPQAALLADALSGSTEQQFAAAYSIVARAHEATLELLAGGAEPSAPETARQLAAIREDEREQLEAVIGPQLTRRVAMLRRASAGGRADEPDCGYGSG